ncbi:hypothetical protein FHT12_002211 [Xanthomonas campestris]|uniref:hypothetical protein n=1 Tax=Xanthomonas euroxanthea TaxID=2259622 RepID=UPI0011B08F16|nr:hypothetical protein [Xanthomonas euroxanthea]NIJ93514.1 hypothetical protein [Xanthomonas euroxanthea]
MSEQSWLAYTGAIAGIIGAVTGIAGAVLAFLAFRRTGQLKSLDLRLELRRAEITLHSDIHGLAPLLESAKTSRTRLAAAQGTYNSSATKHWLAQWDADLADASSLIEGASVLDIDCSAFSQAELEARLVTVHKLQRQVALFAGKYQGSLAADDVGREQLRADQQVITQARIEGKI